ncbi:unnamed protein product [Prorocentrum cordatum]|uniref:Uncharacterized protein n=1 Tax=Prorocentrum cordatum TaxID=2364126 RepID=A0ABN9TIX0_9DINO|nr:unnamed protein product [Polarella glacialis]
MVKLCEVLDLLSIVNAGVVAPTRLMNALVAHYTAQQAHWAPALWKPNNHFNMHLPSQLHRHGLLLSTFLMERKHRAPKRFANERQNTKSFERSLIEDITCQHLFELKYELEGLDLLEPRLVPAVAANRASAPGELGPSAGGAAPISSSISAFFATAAAAIVAAVACVELEPEAVDWAGAEPPVPAEAPTAAAGPSKHELRGASAGGGVGEDEAAPAEFTFNESAVNKDPLAEENAALKRQLSTLRHLLLHDADAADAADAGQRRRRRATTPATPLPTSGTACWRWAARAASSSCGCSRGCRPPSTRRPSARAGRAPPRSWTDCSPGRPSRSARQSGTPALDCFGEQDRMVSTCSGWWLVATRTCLIALVSPGRPTASEYEELFQHYCPAAEAAPASATGSRSPAAGSSSAACRRAQTPGEAAGPSGAGAAGAPAACLWPPPERTKILLPARSDDEQSLHPKRGDATCGLHGGSCSVM